METFPDGCGPVARTEILLKIINTLLERVSELESKLGEGPAKPAATGLSAGSAAQSAGPSESTETVDWAYYHERYPRLKYSGISHKTLLKHFKRLGGEPEYDRLMDLREKMDSATYYTIPQLAALWGVPVDEATAFTYLLNNMDKIEYNGDERGYSIHLL